MISSKNLTFYDIVSSRIFRHGIAWLTIGTITIIVFNSEGLTFQNTLNAIFTILYMAMIVYFNIEYLVPEYLGKKQFIRYFLLMLLSAFMIAPIRTISLYVVYIGNTDMQTEVILTHWNIFVVYIVIALCSTIIKIIFDWFKAQREFNQLQTQTMKSELRFLRSQVNPHFLFNTLNSLYALTLKKSDAAPEIVLKLSEMMRYMLYECNDRYVLLKDEIAYIENYLDLESIRHGDELKIDYNYEGDAGEKKIAPLLFIPFLENAFKHGVNNELEVSYINIRLHILENNVNLSIENSLPEKLPLKTETDNKKSGGIGLINVQRRLDLIYPNEYSLKVSAKENTYKINLSINI